MRPAAKTVGQNISTQFLPTRPALITATDAKFRPEDAATKVSTSEFATNRSEFETQTHTNFDFDFVAVWSKYPYVTIMYRAGHFKDIFPAKVV